MTEYMQLSEDRFLDLNRGLGAVRWYMDLIVAEKNVADKEAAVHAAKAAHAISGASIRDEIYGYLMGNPATEKTPEQQAATLKAVMERFRQAKSTVASPHVLATVAKDAYEVFCVFNDKAFSEAAEATGLLVDSKQAKTAVDAAAGNLSRARKEYNEVRDRYKVGIFTADAPLFKLPVAEQAEAAIARVKLFVKTWERVAKFHKEPVTLGAIAIKSLSTEGGLQQTWKDAYHLLFKHLPKGSSFFLPRNH